MRMKRSFVLRAASGLAALVATTFFLTGCGPDKSDKPASAAATTNAAGARPRPVVPEADPDLLAPLSANNGTMSEADKAWQEVMNAVQSPAPPAEWETNPPTEQALAEFQKKNGEEAVKMAERMKEFYTKYPKQEKAEEARETEHSLLDMAAQFGNTSAAARLAALNEARLKDPNLSEDERIQLRVEQIQRAASARQETNMTAALEELEKGVRSLQKDFPKRPDVAGLIISVAQGRFDNGETDKARTLAKEVLDSQPDDEVKKAAEELVTKLDRVGKPLALKFKAVDGREVDVQQMKGKVVLIDFWATWCGPCMRELPNVKAAYDKLHAKGFEIVGISFDRTKDALEKVTTREKMSWPQYFDDSGMGNRFGDEFGIAGIPTMWLVDKKGLLRDLNAREKLTEKVEKLLGE